VVGEYYPQDHNLLLKYTTMGDSSAANVVIPIIDMGPFLTGTQEERVAVANEIGKACEEIGFFVVKNFGVDPEIIDNAWKASADFFDLPQEEKLVHSSAAQDEYPFGYSEIGGEVLSDGKAKETNAATVSHPDLKEMFSIGPKNPLAGFPPRRWPEQPESFAGAYDAYYDAMTGLANQILRAMAITLGLPSEDYFEQFTDHHGSAMRSLNYPSLDGQTPVPGQIRASAHTDYGTVTLLKSGGPGLQVSKDRDPPTWVDVPHVPDAYIVNLGDLMRRWTNDRWQSTLHRVINPPTGASWGRRQSIAFFYNLNPDAKVSMLVTKDTENEESKYPPIVAGDFLMEKHLASMKK
jgi:isopenicillin N synthase-like dioxygenase